MGVEPIMSGFEIQRHNHCTTEELYYRWFNLFSYYFACCNCLQLQVVFGFWIFQPLSLKFKAFPAPRPSFERWRRGEKTRGSEPVLDLHICYCWKAATRKLSRPMIYLRLPPLGRVYREWICEFQAQSMQKKVYILFKILVFEHPWISTFTSLFYIETKATFYWREYVWWLF